MDQEDLVENYVLHERDISHGTIDVRRKGLSQLKIEGTCLCCNGGPITKFLVDYNDLQEIPREVKLLTDLKELSAIGNEIHVFPEDIASLTQLERLDLSENEIAIIPTSISWNIPHLTSLSLVGNRLKSFPENFFEFFRGLRELYLNENEIEIFPASLCSATNLKIVEANDNKIRSLPDAIGNLDKLEVLSLQVNCISNLPVTFCQLKSIHLLCLSKNSIKELPETFSAAPLIEKLYIDNNVIQVLPDWFNWMKNLKILHIHNNKLIKASFSVDFCRTSCCLQTLKCGSNNIEVLPHNFGDLRSLLHLHLGSTMCELERRAFQNGNWLTELPDSFSNLVELTKCHLDENQLGRLPNDIGKLCKLTWLDLGQNRLTLLPDSFCHLVSLEYLQLAKNPLIKLPENFGDLSKLIELRLDSANLEELPSSFSKLSNLKTLDLFNNRLREIPWQLFQLQKLSRLDLDQNLFDVDVSVVPKLLPINSYPERNPFLGDNWRGKTRQDKVKVESVVMSANGCTDTEDKIGAEADRESAKKNLMNALKQGKGMWRSHTGSSSRKADKYVVHYKGSLRKENGELEVEISNSDDEYEPSEFFSQGKPVVDMGPARVIEETEEDWDAECSGEVECSKQVERIEYLPRGNQATSTTTYYPPADQAKSDTGHYKPLTRLFYRMALINEPRVQPPRFCYVNGQFDDIDEP